MDIGFMIFAWILGANVIAPLVLSAIFSGGSSAMGDSSGLAAV
jgi:hypothetical protein